MTREKLKEHCEKQIEMCEMWATAKGEKPSGKVYEEHKLILELLEQQSEDAISRQAALDIYDDYNVAVENGDLEAYRKHRKRLLKLPPVQLKTGNCKDCKYFEYDHFENMGGIPLITAHKVCKRHGLICKTDEDGYCHLWEYKAESEE